MISSNWGFFVLAVFLQTSFVLTNVNIEGEEIVVRIQGGPEVAEILALEMGYIYGGPVS